MVSTLSHRIQNFHIPQPSAAQWALASLITGHLVSVLSPASVPVIAIRQIVNVAFNHYGFNNDIRDIAPKACLFALSAGTLDSCAISWINSQYPDPIDLGYLPLMGLKSAFGYLLCTLGGCWMQELPMRSYTN